MRNKSSPAIVIRAAGESDQYLTWAVFAAAAISGVSTIIQALRVGRIGAGYVLLMGTSGAFIAVCVTALSEGGPGLLSGLAGTVPNTTYSSSVSVTELTGVAARRVGIAIGISFIVMAFMPKLLALVLAVPDAVVAAYITVLLAMLFVVGMKIVAEDATDYRSSLIAGVSFWIGVGFQNGSIFPEYLDGFAGGFLANGMTAGGLTAVILTVFTEATQARRKQFRTELSMSELPRIREFLGEFAQRARWDASMSNRLDAVAEETLLTLIDTGDPKTGGPRTGGAGTGGPDDGSGDGPHGRTLRLTIGKQDGQAVLEFVAAMGNENIEDRLAVLGEPSVELPVERDLSLRMLGHHASLVLHQQYHELDIVTVHVDVPNPVTRDQP